MKKSLSLILALLLLASSLASCSEKQNDGGEDTSATAETSTDTSAAADDENNPTDLENNSNVKLWEGKTFDGYGVHILGRQDVTYSIDFHAEEITGEIVNDAVYNRNIKVEDELDVTLEYVPHSGDYTQFLRDVTNSVTANDGAYDLVASYAYYGVSLAPENVLYNLHNVPNLTLTNSWFNQSFVNEMTLFDQLYFIVGDLTLTATDRMMITYFNKELAGNWFHDVDFYELVYEGGWTIDYMNEIIANVWTDENGNGRKDGFDTFGLAFNTGSVPTDGLMSALRVQVMQRDTDGTPILTVYNEHVNSAYEKLMNLIYKNEGCGLNMSQNQMFKEGRAIFAMECTTIAKNHLRDFEPDYGILPLPKYNEDQDGYYTTAQDAYNIISIPKTCINFEATGAVLDYLSCLSAETVYPAYFENNFQKQYMRSEADSMMFDFIRDGLEFNFGVVYSNCIANPAHFFRDCVRDNKPVASQYKTKEKIYNRSLDKFLEVMEELKDAE